MIDAYIACAIWASTDDDGNSVDGLELTEDARATMVTELAEFVSYCEVMRIDWESVIDEGQFAHDFWLTRNGHGSGFWDRGLGDLGEKLSEAAKTFGECTLYVTEGKLDVL